MSDKLPIPYPGPRGALDLNPQLLVIYGQQKVGKSEAVCALTDGLVIVLRRGTADHLSGNIMDIEAMCEGGAFGPMPAATERSGLPTGLNDNEAASLVRERFICDAFLRVLDDLYEKRVAGAPVANTIAYDDIGPIENWVFDLALRTYRTTLQGSSPKLADLRRVTDLPGQGNQGSPGWALVWEEFDRMLWRIRRASPRAILIAHMRDKFVNKDTGQVSDTDIDLSGKMRRILLRETSATGYVYRDRDSNLIVTFKSVDGVNCGAWCSHLAGKEIVLGTLDAKRRTIYDWSKIYLPDTPKGVTP